MRGVPFLLVALAAISSAQLRPGERQGVEEGIAIAGLRADELGRPQATGGGLGLIAGVRKSPLDGWDAVSEFGESLAKPFEEARGVLFKGGFNEEAALPTVTAPAGSEALPAALQGPVGRLAAAVARANGEIRTALSKLSPEERRRLIEGLPATAGAPSGLRPEFAKAPSYDPKAVAAALAKVDVAAIRRAGLMLSKRVDAELPAIRKAGAVGNGRLNLGGVVVVLVGEGDADIDASDAGLVVALGGRGRITGRAGAGIGYASVLIDARPKAEVDAPDAGPGSGLLGVGIARFEGAVSGRAGVLAFGAGEAGYGECRIDGAARLEARAMAEGYGDAGGAGLLRLSEARDEVRIGAWGQGAGRARGIGVLSDGGGDDRYEATGFAPDEVLGAKESDAQGYGESGGIGALADAGGDDAMMLSARGQGAGEDRGLGLLYDEEGNDTRTAARFAQGAGDREGIGIAEDRAGDDVSLVRRGEAQGFASRGGIGLLLDRTGNDLYAQGSGSPGSADGGGIAIFLDAAGQDASTGRSAPAEDGSLSLFLALGSMRGVDAASGGTFAAAVIGGGAPTPEGLQAPAAGSLSLNPERIARAAELLATRRGGYREAAVRELTAFGTPGVEAGLGKLESLDEDGIDALARVIAAVGEPARRRALALLGEKPSANGLRLAGMARLPVSGAVVAAALEDPVRRKATALALADGLPAPEVAGAVLPMVLDEDPAVARAAMRAVLRYGGSSEEPSVRALVTTSDPTMRAMAWSFVARRPGAVEFAKGLIGDNDPNRQMAGIGILGATGGDEALRLVGTGLNAPTREVRLAALRALSGRVPTAWRARVVELQNDPDALVRRAAQATLLSR